MKQFLSHWSGSLAWATPGRSGRMARCASVAVVVAASSLACSEATPDTVITGGTGGQAAGGSAGTAVTAGASGMSTGGTPSATSGAAGMAGSGAGSAGASGGGGTGGTGGAGGSAGAGGGGGTSEEGWVPLFNGTNLDGWKASPGHDGLFAAGKVGEDPVIHVYPSPDLQDKQQNVAQAALRTEESYSKYVLHLEYKWGIKRFNDRQGARDNGICFHLCNTLTRVWPDSVEFQLGSDTLGNDWVSGNIFMLVGATRAQWPNARMNNQPYFSETGTKTNLGPPDIATYALGRASAQMDKPNDWNIVELTVKGAAEAEYKVNGMVVNRLFDMQYKPESGGDFVALDHGPIALQAEFAEVYFRNIKIKVLP